MSGPCNVDLHLPWAVDEDAADNPKEGTGHIVVSDCEGGIAALFLYSLAPEREDGEDTAAYARECAAAVCETMNRAESLASSGMYGAA